VGHLGVLSPVTMALAIIVSFDGASDQRQRGRLVYVTSAIGYMALVVLACFGIIPPLLPSRSPIDPKATFLFGLTGEGMLFAAYWVAVVGRRRTLEAMERLESAQVEIRRRQALLDEVRADLDRAMDAARVGRFTGQTIGPYVANEVIGRGGMGEVYRGVRVETGELVALKVLHAQFQGEKDQLERFFREAEVTTQLASPHIVRVLERGRAPDGSPFLAMELLVGYDLAHALRRHSRLGMNDVLEMVSHVAGGLSAAQEAGIVHRDIKPQNVFRARVGGAAVWKVLDFGVSKISDFAGTLTHGAIVGTPGYMSPEQARGLPLSHRSDVFSLGALAYRALTGRPAFHAADPLSTTYQVVHKMPARPGEIVPKLNPDIDYVLALALAKDAKDRFKSAVSFAAALRDASRGELDDRLRAAAKELLVRNPWGTERSDRKE
jgi:serine/threonine-protein kinase